MVLLRRLGLGIVVLLFSVLLVVFALFASTYMVLDKPLTLKNALMTSGVYDVVVEKTLEQKNQELSAALPLDNPEVRQALKDAFPVSYLQSTAEHNIDATYDWVHGTTQKPDYRVDVSQPKETFAANLARLAETRMNSLPACTKMVEMPVTATDVLEMTCLPPGVPPSLIAANVREQATESKLLDDIAAATAAVKGKGGQSLADRMGFIPKAYGYYIISLYVIPVVLVLSALGVLYWSMSRRLGLRRVGGILLATGFISIGLAILIAWLLGFGARSLGNSDASWLALQSRLLEAAHLIGAQLRNWLIGIGAGYVVAGIAVLVLFKFKNRQNAEQNEDLNKSLGYSSDIPSAGTTFGPKAPQSAKAAGDTQTAPKSKSNNE